MQPIDERKLFIAILAVLSVATLFCLIGLAAPGWLGYSLFSLGRTSTATAALCVISFLLLIGCVVMAVIILIGIVTYELLPIIFIALLIVSSIFLLGTITSFVGTASYSYNLIVTAFAFTYLSSIAATYWQFGARGANEGTTTPSKQQQQQQQQQPPRLDMF